MADSRYGRPDLLSIRDASWGMIVLAAALADCTLGLFASNQQTACLTRCACRGCECRKPPQREKSMTATTGPRRTSRAGLMLVAALLSLPLLNASVQAQQAVSLRTLSGTVTDSSHEPLRGAIVELQNSADNSVQTYLTTEDGHYLFKRLNSNADYRVWVVFRTRHTPARSVSKFDSHLTKVIDFKISPH
jgi:hypothetical protein